MLCIFKMVSVLTFLKTVLLIVLINCKNLIGTTLAKNATKPNPFEIILLQPTRKEYNWKTEEALARAAVTLETEGIKGSKSLMSMMMTTIFISSVFTNLVIAQKKTT